MAQYRDSPTEQDQRDARYGQWESLYSQQTSPFKDLIQRDPVVCDNCFLKRYHTFTLEWWRGSLGWMDYEKWIPIPGTGTEVPSDQPSEGTRLACSNCGHRRGKERPVPKDRILEYAENISETLDRKEVVHCQDTLFAEIEERNTSENQCRQDSHVFDPSVRAAVRTK